MRALLLVLALAGCARTVTAPAGITLPVAPGWRVRLYTAGLGFTTPLLTIRARPGGEIGAAIIKEF